MQFLTECEYLNGILFVIALAPALPSIVNFHTLHFFSPTLLCEKSHFFGTLPFKTFWRYVFARFDREVPLRADVTLLSSLFRGYP